MKPLEPLFDGLLSNWLGLAGLFGIFVVFKILASPTFKGWFGEKMVHRRLRQLDPSQYRVFHDLYLPHPSEQGTTQIDHVLVSPFGIFVIETKSYRSQNHSSRPQASIHTAQRARPNHQPPHRIPRSPRRVEGKAWI